MPLTPFQREVAQLLAAHRNPESHVAGGAVINRSNSSPRYSEDLDIFHDVAQSVAICAEADAEALRTQGYDVGWVLRQPGFFRAEVKRAADHLRLDWTTDSVFRFFPVQTDPDFGYCLHPADLAVNKILALAGRVEIRDFLDILHLDKTYLSLGAMIWAACGKDPGYTPALLLDMSNRHSDFHESDLKGENLARQLDLKELKMQWLAARDGARILFARLPEEELGCLYLDAANEPVTPDPSNPNFPHLKRHVGSVRGAWPKIS
jgi:Nucleotidyl transferase AbiEii toxin, Type IV TA system